MHNTASKWQLEEHHLQSILLLLLSSKMSRILPKWGLSSVMRSDFTLYLQSTAPHTDLVVEDNWSACWHRGDARGPYEKQLEEEWQLPMLVKDYAVATVVVPACFVIPF